VPAPGVPRQRPTSTAMLVQLGGLHLAQAGPDEEQLLPAGQGDGLSPSYQRSPQIGPLGDFAASAPRTHTPSASYTETSRLLQARPPRKPGHGRPALAPAPAPVPGLRAGARAPAGGGGCGRHGLGRLGLPSGRPWSWSASSWVPRSAARVRRAHCRARAGRRRPKTVCGLILPRAMPADPMRAW